MNKKIIAIIPARGNSKGLKRKNMCELNGKPLIEHTINAAKKCDLIDEVFVTTEDKEIKEFALSLDVSLIDRPNNLSQDHIQNNDVIRHALEIIKNNYNYLPEITVLLQPTSPLRDESDIKACVQGMIAKNTMSAISVYESDIHPAKAILIKNENAFPYGTIEDMEKRRQDLEKTYYQNGAIYAVKTEQFLKQKSFYIQPCFAYVMKKEKSVDIDSEIDLEIAELYSKVLTN